MKKRILSLMLVLAMVIGMIPFTASATGTGTVYISISDDEKFITAPDGTPMGFFAVTLEELASVDLDAYELGEYAYDADGDGAPDIAALHLYIYVHEEILGLDWSDVYVSGSAGSIYFAGGLFGFSDENLRYDLNGAYPAVDGWGLTADQIVLSDGDFLNVAHYNDWAFWGDSATGFHYFTDVDGNLQHTYELEVGETLELGLVRSYSDWMNGGIPAFVPEAEYAVYCGVTYGEPFARFYTGEDGIVEVEFPEDDTFLEYGFPPSGTWYVWADGGYGMENSEAIVSAPAFATVNIKGEPDLHFTLDLTGLEDPIYDGGIVITNLANPNEFAYLDDTAEAGNKIEYAFRAEEYDQYIVYVDFYSDSPVIGWNVNGVNYFAEDPGDGYVDWDLGNDCWAGYGFGYKGEADREYIEFYLQLGLESAYNTAGSWDIKPVLLTYNVLDAMDAIFAIYDNEEITLESGEAIRNATALYEALSDMEKEVLAYLDPEITEMLEEAQETYNTLLGDRETADAVEALITAIGSVDLTKEAAITAAREAYDALNDTRKAMVSNYAALTAAEEKLQQLKDEAAQAAADQAAADAVEEQIATIGTVTVFSGKKIDAARTAFDALTDAQKALVENANQLTAAESALTEAYKQAAKADHKAVFDATGKYIAGLGTPGVGSTGGEWMVIALTRAGQSCPEGYYQNVVDFVKAEINDKEQLHRSKSTENSRIILALTAAGYDVTNVDGHNLLMGLTDMTYIPKQGINGPIWALIAFDSHNYEIPVNPNATEQATREKLIAYILEKQLADGGWDLANRAADPDMTGMAIQALAPYYNTNNAVKTAVDKALICLSNKQLANGGFGSIDGICTESCAQVVVALTALGIDPETDSRFIKNGMSVVDAMCLFAVEGGGFAHVPAQGVNGMATEQGQYALAAYFRLKEDNTSLYDMTDVMLPGEVVSQQISAIGTVTLESEKVITDARVEYDALSAYQKTLVDNYDILTAAEKTLSDLKAAADKAAADQAAADAVTAKISSIGTVTKDSETAIKTAREAYDALTAEQKALVRIYDVLTAAEAKLAELKQAASENPDKPQTKVEITEGGITTVPESLKQAGLDTPEEVKQEMMEAIIEKNKETDQKNVAHYDVALMYSEDGGKTWIKADETHFPANGKITVTIPYPAGTDSTYDFTVVHMFTSNAFGKTPGDVEMPKVTKAKDGIQFEVTGLSPISVGWTAPKTSDIPQTGDNTNIALYTSLMLVSFAGLAAVMYFDRKRKYAGKYSK